MRRSRIWPLAALFALVLVLAACDPAQEAEDPEPPAVDPTPEDDPVEVDEEDPSERVATAAQNTLDEGSAAVDVELQHDAAATRDTAEPDTTGTEPDVTDPDATGSDGDLDTPEPNGDVDADVEGTEPGTNDFGTDEGATGDDTFENDVAQAPEDEPATEETRAALTLSGESDFDADMHRLAPDTAATAGADTGPGTTQGRVSEIIVDGRTLYVSIDGAIGTEAPDTGADDTFTDDDDAFGDPDDDDAFADPEIDPTPAPEDDDLAQEGPATSTDARWLRVDLDAAEDPEQEPGARAGDEQLLLFRTPQELLEVLAAGDFEARETDGVTEPETTEPDDTTDTDAPGTPDPDDTTPPDTTDPDDTTTPDTTDPDDTTTPGTTDPDDTTPPDTTDPDDTTTPDTTTTTPATGSQFTVTAEVDGNLATALGVADGDTIQLEVWISDELVERIEYEVPETTAAPDTTEPDTTGPDDDATEPTDDDAFDTDETPAPDTDTDLTDESVTSPEDDEPGVTDETDEPPATQQTEGALAGMTVAIAYSNHGVEVDIEGPQDDEVEDADVAQVRQILRGLLEDGPTGAGVAPDTGTDTEQDTDVGPDTDTDTGPDTDTDTDTGPDRDTDTDTDTGPGTD